MCDVACLSRQRQVSVTTARLCLRGPTYRTCRRWRRPSSSSVVVVVVRIAVVCRRPSSPSLSVVVRCRYRHRPSSLPSSSVVVVVRRLLSSSVVIVRRRRHRQSSSVTVVVVCRRPSSLSVVLFRRSLHRQRLIDVAYLVSHETVEHTVFTLRKFMRNCSSVCVASRYSLMFVAFLLVLSSFILCNVIYGVSNKMFSFNTSFKFNFCTAR